MRIHIGYCETGSTWPQQLARSEAYGFAKERGVPYHQIEENLVRRPAFERRPRRAFEWRLVAGWRRQIATDIGDSHAESNLRTVAMTGLPQTNRCHPREGFF